MSGLVYRARKQSIGKDYAIKFLQVDDGEAGGAVAVLGDADFGDIRPLAGIRVVIVIAVNKGYYVCILLN